MIRCPKDEQELEEALSRPGPGLIEFARTLGDRLVVLGAGGKMGPSLARMARRAADAAGRSDYEVIAVSRFGNAELRQQLERDGIRTVACDLLDPAARQRLPDASEVVIMLGYKFATGERDPAEYWGRNAYLHATLAERYRTSRIVCFSTGNVYPMVPVHGPGANENTPCEPLGIYAEAAYGRELLVSFVSKRHGTPVAFIRLNYAVDLRYGVPVDIACMLLEGKPVPLQMGYVNFVWQRYANEVSLRALGLASSPPTVLNVTGPEKVPVAEIARRLAQKLGLEARFEGEPAETAYLSDARRCHQLFGPPDVSAYELIDMVAAWLLRGGKVSGKPTKFWVRDGNF